MIRFYNDGKTIFGPCVIIDARASFLYFVTSRPAIALSWEQRQQAAADPALTWDAATYSYKRITKAQRAKALADAQRVGDATNRDANHASPAAPATSADGGAPPAPMKSFPPLVTKTGVGQQHE